MCLGETLKLCFLTKKAVCENRKRLLAYKDLKGERGFGELVK